VHFALKWEGGQNQAVFDFGTSSDNRMVLTPEGASGKAELLITREGKTERVIADAALPKGKWAECRLEIDGKTIALWVDGRKAAEKASSFRAADVYPAGAVKRNFIAADRNGEHKFQGVLDYLRVWHAVFDDFANAPTARRHAPRRITKEFMEWHAKEFSGAAEAKEKKIQARYKPAYAYYQQIHRRLGQVHGELRGSPGGKAAHKHENDWLETFGWMGFSHHYNYPYRLFIRDKIAKDIGGKVSHESGEMGTVYALQTNAKWHTRCDWEWRMKQELDGSVEKLPLLQKWIRKVRGPVMAEKPKEEGK